MQLASKSLILAACALAAVFSLFPPGILHAAITLQQAGGVRPAEPKFRLMRSVSGGKGWQQGGRYVIEDPRTVFYIPDDRQVIVYLEWEGPVGLHHFEGLWKNPEGKVAVISDFNYEAKEKRFAGYWTLALTETAPTGVWTLEARVDGELAGSHTFQIVAAPRPATAIPTKRILSASEIYQKALASSVFVQNLDVKGEPKSVGSGFLIGEGLLATTFQVIDGASLLRVTLPDGQRVETDQVLAWNRRQDWVILKVATGKAAPLARAQPESWSVGDRCYSLDSPAEGNRVIVEAEITGKNSFSEAGERINISFGVSPSAVGSPLLNDYGELIGMVGGNLIPGARSIENLPTGYSEILGIAGGPLRGGLAIPVTVISSARAETRPTTLGELGRSGQFIFPVTARASVLYGVLAAHVERKGPIPRPVNQKHQFSRRDPTMSVFVSWEPQKGIKSKALLRVYDLDNRLRLQTNPTKIQLRADEPTFSFTDLPLADFSPGIYRLDVFLGEEVAWRSFFRVTE